jgi:hypothetical protein
MPPPHEAIATRSYRACSRIQYAGSSSVILALAFDSQMKTRRINIAVAAISSSSPKYHQSFT